MHISLAIATIGRTKELTRLLDSLCSQTYKDFSVLICDQNPQGFLDKTLKPYGNQLNISHIFLSPRGVSAARNALLPYANGQVIAFPDDDCWYAPDTLEQVIKFFSENKNVDAFMGIWSDNANGIQVELLKQDIAKPLSKFELFIRGETYVQFFRQNIIQSIGGFDEELGPGTGLPYGGAEDTDYILRASKFTQIWLVPTVHLFHQQPCVSPSNKSKIYPYSYGRMKLLRKHNFPLWFKWANVLFPLYKILREKPCRWNYRWCMFCGRLYGLFQR